MPCLSTIACLSWHHSANQPESLEASRSCSTPPEVFWCISFYGVTTNRARLCIVRQTNKCVSLVKNPSSWILSCTCFSRASFHLCLLQRKWNVPSSVCPSERAFHLGPLQRNIDSHVCLSKTSFYMCLLQQNVLWHNWLSKETTSFHLKMLSFLSISFVMVPLNSNR